MYKCYHLLGYVLGVATLTSVSAGPPAANLVLPLAASTFSAPATIALVANASDPEGAVSRVEFYNGTQLIDTVTTPPYRVNLSIAAVGSYDLSAKVFDGEGLSATSNVVTVNVLAPDATNPAPTVALNAPGNGYVYAEPATVSVGATAADASGVNRIEFHINGSIVAADTTVPFGADLGPLAAGTYTLTAIAFDRLGKSTESASRSFTVFAPVPGNTAPTVSLTNPIPNATYLTTDTFDLSATADDPGGSINRVEFYIGSAQVRVDTTAPYSGGTQGRGTPGTYAVAARAFDNLGLAATQTVNIVVSSPNPGNSPPSVSLTSPATNTVLPAPATLSLSASASDGNGSVNRVEFYLGTTLAGVVTAPPYALTLSNVAAGSYAITAKAFDDGGASTVSQISSVIVNALPTVTLTAPANNAVFNAPATVTLTANATDPGGAVAKVEFFDGTTLLGTALASPYTLTLNGIAAGTHAYTAKVTDSVGASATSATANVIVNALPTVSITSPTNNSAVNAPGAITLSADAQDTDGVINRVQFFNGAIALGSDFTAPFNLALNQLAPGTYSFTATATDNRNAVATSSPVTVTVNAPPTVELTAPAASSAFVPPATIALAADANDVDGSISRVEFYAGTNLVGTAVAAPFRFNWTGVTNGSYSLTAKAYDNSVGVTTSSPVSILVDAPPSLSLTSPAANAGFLAPAVIVLKASASDADGAVTKVEFYEGANLLKSVTSQPFEYTWNTAAPGTYELSAKAYDNQGRITATAPFSISVFAATVTPTTYTYDELGRLIGVQR